MKIKCDNGRIFEIDGVDVREPEWFPEKRSDILRVFFAEDVDGLITLQSEPEIGLNFWVDFLTNKPIGNYWFGGIITEILEK